MAVQAVPGDSELGPTTHVTAFALLLVLKREYPMVLGVPLVFCWTGPPRTYMPTLASLIVGPAFRSSLMDGWPIQAVFWLEWSIVLSRPHADWRWLSGWMLDRREIAATIRLESSCMVATSRLSKA
jgi:hypothetical protein